MAKAFLAQASILACESTRHPSLALQPHPIARSRAVVTESVSAGTVLLAASPLSTVLIQPEKGRRCDLCLRPNGNLQRCTGCKAYWYCGRICQMKAWKMHHRHICKTITDFTNSLYYKGLTNSEQLHVLLLTHLIAEHGSILHETFGKYDQVSEDIGSLDPIRALLSLLPQTKYERLAYEIPLQNVNNDLISHLSQRFANNNFTIHCSRLDTFAHGIFPLASRFFNHSCFPSAVPVYIPLEGSKPIEMRIKILRDLNPGDEVTIPYIDPALSYARRQDGLKNTYQFHCTCILCQHDSDYVKRESSITLADIQGKIFHSICDNPAMLESSEFVSLRQASRNSMGQLLPNLSKNFSDASHSGLHSQAIEVGSALLVVYCILYPSLHALELAKVYWNAYITDNIEKDEFDATLQLLCFAKENLEFFWDKAPVVNLCHEEDPLNEVQALESMILLEPRNMIDSPLTPTSQFPTRTVAIIKPHALPHRLDIERHITEAGFEIAKERQMMFRDNDRDVEVLFGVSNAKSLAERPCWVYVLERRRAVEVLKTLMGDEDPDSARQINANTLRALYGVSKQDNAIFGSPDASTAEDQISILFASSPPLRSVDLPDCLPINFGEASQAITTHILTELNEQNGDLQSPPNSAPSVSSKATSTTAPSPKSSNGFRARPMPATTIEPSMRPRLSHAAALRAGLVKPVVTIWHKNPRKPLSKEEQQRLFTDVPGHKRSETLSVPSTAPPAITPRMTRSASLRQGIKDSSPSSTKPRVRNPEAERKAFDGVPGHKRRETITVASVQPPAVAPRPNRAATLRAERERVPPSSYMFRTPSNNARTPRSSSALQVNPPSDTRPNSAIGSRPSSAALTRPSSVTPSLNKRASVIPVPVSLKKPTVEPRQNKSALLRAKKLEGARDGSGRINGKPVFV